MCCIRARKSVIYSSCSADVALRCKGAGCMLPRGPWIQNCSTRESGITRLLSFERLKADERVECRVDST
jgi:hypothetical protein